MRNSQYEEVLDRVNIREVAEHYGLRFNSRGYAVCPFHSEKTASFKVQNEKYAHCFGCGANSNAITLVQKIFDVDATSAMRLINEDFRLGLPIDRKATLQERLISERRRRERLVEKERKEMELTEWRTNYDRLWGLWCAYDTAIRHFDGTVTDEYAAALREIDYISYLIDIMPQEPK